MVLDNLDLTDPADLAFAFLSMRPPIGLTAIMEDDWNRALAMMERHAPMVFGVEDHDLTPEAVRTLIWQMGGKEEEGGEIVYPRAPREWLAIFREAFERGDIGPVSFATAFRFFMTKLGGNGVPNLPCDALAARKLLLAEARRLQSDAFMSLEEREYIASLPDTVVLHRGGQFRRTSSALSRSQSLHWTSDHALAESYARIRAYQQLTVEIDEAERTGSIAKLCWPYIVTVRIPKELVLAYVPGGIASEHNEFWVDFEGIEPDMVIEDVELGPIAAAA